MDDLSIKRFLRFLVLYMPTPEHFGVAQCIAESGVTNEKTAHSHSAWIMIGTVVILTL